MVSPSPSQTERFDTGGRALGWVGLVCSVGLVVVWLTQVRDPLPVPVLTGAVLAALLFWAAIIRPAVSVSGDDLLMRNMLADVRVPLASIEEIALRQVLVVRAGDHKIVGTGVGRSLKNSALGGMGAQPVRAGEPGDVGGLRLGGGFAAGTESLSAIRGGGTSQVVNAADHVETRLGDLAAEARARAGVTRYSDEQVALAAGLERHPTWPVVVPLVLALAAFLASFWL